MHARAPMRSRTPESVQMANAAAGTETTHWTVPARTIATGPRGSRCTRRMPGPAAMLTLLFLSLLTVAGKQDCGKLQLFFFCFEGRLFCALTQGHSRRQVGQAVPEARIARNHSHHPCLLRLACEGQQQRSGPPAWAGWRQRRRPRVRCEWPRRSGLPEGIRARHG